MQGGFEKTRMSMRSLRRKHQETRLPKKLNGTHPHPHTSLTHLSPQNLFNKLEQKKLLLCVERDKAKKDELGLQQGAGWMAGR